MKKIYELEILCGGLAESDQALCEHAETIEDAQYHILPYPYPIEKPIGLPKPLGIDDDQPESNDLLVAPSDLRF